MLLWGKGIFKDQDQKLHGIGVILSFGPIIISLFPYQVTALKFYFKVTAIYQIIHCIDICTCSTYFYHGEFYLIYE